MTYLPYTFKYLTMTIPEPPLAPDTFPPDVDEPPPPPPPRFAVPATDAAIGLPP